MKKTRGKKQNNNKKKHKKWNNNSSEENNNRIYLCFFYGEYNFHFNYKTVMAEENLET